MNTADPRTMARLRSSCENESTDLNTLFPPFGLVNVSPMIQDRFRADHEQVMVGYSYIEVTRCDLVLKFVNAITGQVHYLGNGQPFCGLSAGLTYSLEVRGFAISGQGYAFQPPGLHKNLFSFHRLWFKIAVTQGILPSVPQCVRLYPAATTEVLFWTSKISQIILNSPYVP